MAGLGDELKIKYVPIWPQADTDMKFHYYEIDEKTGEKVLKIDESKFKLVDNLDYLREFAKKCEGKLIAFDTETTGLTYGKDHIVGFSLSLDRWSGIYVPIRHMKTLEFIKEVPKVDDNGKPVILKSGKQSIKKIKTYEYEPVENNLDPKESLDILYDILKKAERVLIHNAEFDLTMMKFEGYNILPIHAFDTVLLPYIYDPEATGKGGLKALEKLVLGRTVPEFKDVLGKKHENFSLVPPEDGFVYACCDTAGLYGVYEEMYPKVKALLKGFDKRLVLDGKKYNILAKDNMIVKAFVDYYGHAKILIDKERALEYKKQLEEKQRKVVNEIYNYFDAGTFNLSASSKEFKEVMRSKDVLTRVKTAKGGDSWSSDALKEMKEKVGYIKTGVQNHKKLNYVDGKLMLDNSISFNLANAIQTYCADTFELKNTRSSLNIKLKGVRGSEAILPRNTLWITLKSLYYREIKKVHILELIQENNSLNKALNSYVDKLTKVDECYMNYRLKGTKSGRLSSGNGSKNDKRKNHYYIDLNAQNLTKPKSSYYSVVSCDKDDPEGILGWKFNYVPKDYAMEHLEDEYIVEGQDHDITIRSCLIAPKGRYVVSLDFDAQELKVQCALSGDSKVKQNFLDGLDPHEATAVGIWGRENYDKSKRKKAKAVNFLMSYMGGPATLAEYIGSTLEEAQDIIKKYELAFPETMAWKQKSISEMYMNGGIAYSAFGRPRQFKGWLRTINNAIDNEEDYFKRQDIEKHANGIKKAIERRTVNHKIQSTCGDILRYILLKLYFRYFYKRDPHIDFLSTVHDEINYTIDKEVMIPYVKELEEIMTFRALDPDLHITTSTDIGYSYGSLFPFVWKDESKSILIPKRMHSA